MNNISDTINGTDANSMEDRLDSDNIDISILCSGLNSSAMSDQNASFIENDMDMAN